METLDAGQSNNKKTIQQPTVETRSLAREIKSEHVSNAQSVTRKKFGLRGHLPVETIKELRNEYLLIHSNLTERERESEDRESWTTSEKRCLVGFDSCYTAHIT